jgi:hypothetical protein
MRTTIICTSTLLMLLALAGCTSLDVRPIPKSAHLEKVCIQFNDDMNVSDLVQVIQEDAAAHGIKSVVFKAEKPAGCSATARYTADRWWDITPYMVDATVTLENDSGFLGSLHYHMTGHGGLSLAKWEGTHAKLDPAMDAMLINYPKQGTQ